MRVKETKEVGRKERRKSKINKKERVRGERNKTRNYGMKNERN